MLEKQSTHLQLRLTPTEKEAIRKAAEDGGVTMSEWVRSQLFSSERRRFQQLVGGVGEPSSRREALAELNDFLDQLSGKDFGEAVARFSGEGLSEVERNYIAAMVEVAAHEKEVASPEWTQECQGLEEPYFASSLPGLRIHLLTTSPPPFRKRNIFVDSTVGDRV